MPKHGMHLQNRAHDSKKRQANNLFDVEANSSTFKPVLETPDSGHSAQKDLENGEPVGSEASDDLKPKENVQAPIM